MLFGVEPPPDNAFKPRLTTPLMPLLIIPMPIVASGVIPVAVHTPGPVQVPADVYKPKNDVEIQGHMNLLGPATHPLVLGTVPQGHAGVTGVHCAAATGSMAGENVTPGPTSGLKAAAKDTDGMNMSNKYNTIATRQRMTSVF